jgi:hypothetical protein
LLCEAALRGTSGDDTGSTSSNDVCDWSFSEDVDTERESLGGIGGKGDEFFEWKYESLCLASGEEVGDDDAIDETSVKAVSREPDEVSDSSAEEREEDPEDTEKDAFRWARTAETSGALYDSMFVVDRRATGEDIFRTSISLSENRILAARVGGG